MGSRKRTIYAEHPREAGGTLLGPAQSAVLLLPITEVLLLGGVFLPHSLSWLSQRGDKCKASMSNGCTSCTGWSWGWQAHHHMQP